MWNKTCEVVQPRNWKARRKLDGAVDPSEIKHLLPHSPCQIPFSCGQTFFC
ncbi:hypothetical protein OROGR_022178 [Orobanche gracilis]